MLAFSAVTQFPTNGSSTRGAGETVQASTSAGHAMIGEKRKIRIASLELGTARTFLVNLAPPRLRPHFRRAWVPPRFRRRANPLIW